MLRSLFSGIAIFGYMYIATFQDACAMRTAKHVKVTWTDEEAMLDNTCREFYCRAISNNFDKGESLNDVADYIGLLEDCIENLTYENPSLNDKIKRGKFESWICILTSLLQNKKSRTDILSF